VTTAGRGLPRSTTARPPPGSAPSHGRSNAWRDSVFGYHHFRSTAREVLSVAAGDVWLAFAGLSGQQVTVRAGDVRRRAPAMSFSTAILVSVRRSIAGPTTCCITSGKAIIPWQASGEVTADGRNRGGYIVEKAATI